MESIDKLTNELAVINRLLTLLFARHNVQDIPPLQKK